MDTTVQYPGSNIIQQYCTL